MGSNSASTGGGGGGVGPAGMTGTTVVAGKRKRTYGKEKDAKKVSKRNELRTTIKEGGVIGKIARAITGKTPYEINLERRQKFVKSKGLTSEEINLDPSYLGSEEGLRELRKQGYKTASDTVNDRNDNGGGNQIVQAPTETMATVTAPTEAEVSQATTTEATSSDEDPLYRKRRTKRRGRSLTILTSSKGDTSSLTLGRRSLLGS